MLCRGVRFVVKSSATTSYNRGRALFGDWSFGERTSLWKTPLLLSSPGIMSKSKCTHSPVSPAGRRQKQCHFQYGRAGADKGHKTIFEGPLYQNRTLPLLNIRGPFEDAGGNPTFTHLIHIWSNKDFSRPQHVSFSCWTLTGICLDDIRLGTVWQIGEVEPGSVGRGAGVTVPLRIEGLLAADDAAGALAPEIPSKGARNRCMKERAQSVFPRFKV